MADDLNTLFDLEIPIKATGLAATREDFRIVERAATDTANRAEQAMGKLAPPRNVAQGFRETTVAAQRASVEMGMVGQAATRTANADASLAARQQQVAEGLKGIARDILQAKQAFDAGTLSSEGLATALETARQQAVALKGGLMLPTQQAEAFRVIMSATVPALQAADGVMKIIAEDVAMASAAFRAGTISAEDYAVAMQTARAQAIAASQGTQLAGSELTLFNRVLKQTETGTGPVRQGLGTMRSSMLSLAATMVGTRSTLGTLAGAMLQFSIGNPLAVGVSAGILGLVVLYEKLTEGTRKAKEATDKLIESLRKERDERIAAEHPELPFNATTAQIRARQQQLQRDLATALKGKAVSAGTGGRGTTIVDQQRVAELRAQIRDLDTLQLEALRRENEAQRALTESRRADLIELVRSGKATRAEEAELRAELVATTAELAGMSAATRATVEGRHRAADLTQRITAIEGAFGKTVRATAQAADEAGKALRERTDALIALQGLEGPTVERWQALTERAATLRAELAAGNLTLAERVERLTELQQIEQAQDFGQPKIEKIARRPDPLFRAPINPAFVEPVVHIPGPKGSLFGALVQQAREDGKAVTDAIADVQATLAAAGAELGDSFTSALTAGVTRAASGGGIGKAIAGFIGDMLSALGGMAIKFGIAVSGIGKLMAAAMKALASLNPIAVIAAGIALVALGAALKSAASDSFGGSGRSSASAPAPITQTITVGSAGTAPGPATGVAELGLGASVAGATGATGLRAGVTSAAAIPSAAVALPSLPRLGTPTATSSTVTMPGSPASLTTLQPMQQNTFHFTVIGPGDPQAQRQIKQMVDLATARGV